MRQLFPPASIFTPDPARSAQWRAEYPVRVAEHQWPSMLSVSAWHLEWHGQEPHHSERGEEDRLHSPGQALERGYGPSLLGSCWGHHEASVRGYPPSPRHVGAYIA